jgi:hypothetical protein
MVARRTLAQMLGDRFGDVADRQVGHGDLK